MPSAVPPLACYNPAVDNIWQWVLGLNPYVAVMVLTWLPIFELRASIPYGILVARLPVWQVMAIAIACNWLVAPLVYLFLKYLMHHVLRWKWFAGLWERFIERFQRRIHKAVEGWGAWGLAIFIGIPLPGSGVYAGALGAYLLGMGFRRFLLVSFCGVTMAACIVLLVTLSGSGIFHSFIKPPPVIPHP